MSRSGKYQSLVVVCTMVIASALLVASPVQAALTTRTLSISASPVAALGGTNVTFSGKLSKSPKGSNVKIQRKVGTKWFVVRTTKTKTAAGAYAVALARPAKPGYYVYRAFAPAFEGLRVAYSKNVTVAALRKTYFNRPDPTHEFVMLASTGSSSAIGSLKSPYTSGAKATLQRRDAGVWVTVGTSTVGTNGIFQIPYATPKNGDHRVLIARKGLNAAATSMTEGYVFT